MKKFYYFHKISSKNINLFKYQKEHGFYHRKRPDGWYWKK